MAFWMRAGLLHSVLHTRATVLEMEGLARFNSLSDNTESTQNYCDDILMYVISEIMNNSSILIDPNMLSIPQLHHYKLQEETLHFILASASATATLTRCRISGVISTPVHSLACSRPWPISASVPRMTCQSQRAARAAICVCGDGW